jgi:hypothetical protein
MKPLHELDALCAEKVAGWRDVMPAGYVDPESGTTYYTPTGGTFHNPFRRQIPSYTTDPAAVLGLLEKEAAPGIVSIEMEAAIPQLWRVSLSYRGQGAETDTFDAEAPTFAKAGVLALLRARGVEVE